jgi:hypothetical protein
MMIPAGGLKMRNLLCGLGGALFILAWVCAAHADPSITQYRMSKVGFPELKISLGSRPASMGEAFVALADDLNSTLWNPAGLSLVKENQMGFFHNKYLVDNSLEYLAYAGKLTAENGLGAYLAYLDYGAMDKTVASASDGFDITGSFRPILADFGLGFGQKLLPSLSCGVTLKYLRQSIDTYSYSALAFDIGGLYQPFAEKLRFGFALQNVGTSFNDQPLPLNIKAGTFYELPVHLLFAQDACKVVGDVNLPVGDVNYTSISFGTEYAATSFLMVRLGYKIENNSNLDGVKGLTAGIGITVNIFEVDYALVTLGDMGLVHQIGLVARF